MTLTVWRLKAKEDRRFRAGHPWVYSNELQGSPKGIQPGDPIELCDAGGNFLARGYGNPASLIAFRTLSRLPEIKAPHEPEAVLATLRRALELRASLGLEPYSFRLCYAEADDLPGLVIDRYLLNDGAQVFAVQAHTAGADRWVPQLEELIRGLALGDWARTAIVVRNDLAIRKLEGLLEQEPRVLRAGAGIPLADAAIRVRPALGTEAFLFRADLLGGQKTGFFLDQNANIRLAADRLAGLQPAKAGAALRILDLCSYVGQWGTQFAGVFRGRGHSVEVLAIDASARALELARANVEAQGARFEALKGDVLRDLGELDTGRFDLVICDPPGLIKSRKDYPQGKHAYLQLNTQAFRLVRRGGAIISCSCSGLLEEEDFLQLLAKAAGRNQQTARWVARGSQGPDHPMLTSFPEGRYLKAWVGRIDP